MKSKLSIFLLFLCLNLSAQDFFREDFDKSKNYILLANPTVKNIETIRFLTRNNLLKVNFRKLHFVGIYHADQQYNFEETAQYIQKEGLTHFSLHEFRSAMDEDKLFEANDLTNELKFLFQHSAGIFFFGGPDIPPALYNETNSLSVVTDPQRHYFEASFLFHLLGGYQNQEFIPFLTENPRYLVTGFCLGMQTMNVATGGTLIQDIPSEIYNATTPEEVVKTGKENMHRNYWQIISTDPQLMRINFHTLRFSEHPFFGTRVKTKKSFHPLVYSSHHQSVEATGKGLLITAYSADGKVVEGLAHSRFPHVFAVQFHPEIPALYEDGEPMKFQPDQPPQPYHSILGRKNVKFHKRYWKYISKTVKKACR